MENISTEQKMAPAIDEISTENHSRLTVGQGLYGSNSVSQRDYLQLLLAQERRLENLERENRKLMAERDVLNEKYKTQLQINEASMHQVHLPAGTSSNNRRTDNMVDLPMIDAAEFQPVKDVQPMSLLQQTKLMAANVFAPVRSVVRFSTSWIGSKLVSLVT